MNDPGKTSIKGIDGKPLPNSVCVANFFTIGGIEQWVMIRGEDKIKNPILLMLHGGPGSSETNLFRFHNADLEQFFTVVYWDQRGSGKSFNESIPKISMNINQFVTDLDELLDIILKKIVLKDKVIIFGHEWGSVLGTIYAAKFPQKVSAYVGCGQRNNRLNSEKSIHTYLLNEAERRNLKYMLSDLKEMGPPPHTVNQMFRQRHLLSEVEGKETICSRWDSAFVNCLAPEGSFWDLLSSSPQYEFSMITMWDEISKINLVELVPELKVPVLFFLGRNDHLVPSDVSVDFINNLSAPSKKIVWFVNSGNSPFTEEAAIFNMSMVKLVRPLAM